MTTPNKPVSVCYVIGAFKIVTWLPNGIRETVEFPRGYRFTEDQAEQLFSLLKQAAPLPVAEHKLNAWTMDFIKSQNKKPTSAS
jgi:hypothetical protein